MVVRAVDALLDAVEHFAGAPGATDVWKHVTQQTREPRARPRAGAPRELYQPDVVEALTALTPSVAEMRTRTGRPKLTDEDRKLSKRIAAERRALVLRQTFDRMLATTNIKVHDTTADPEAEWQLLGVTVRNYLKSKSDYINNRSGLLASFGALEVGTAQALRNAEKFYREEIVSVTFLGRETTAHRSLQPKLDAATALLTERQRKSIAAEITYFEGLSIRPNTNNPLKLSNTRSEPQSTSTRRLIRTSLNFPPDLSRR